MDKKTFIREKRPYRVGFLLVDGFALMSCAAISEPFRAANLLAGRELYRLSNHAAEGSRAISSNRVVVPDDGDISKAHDLDLVMVVAGGHADAFLRAPIRGVLRELDRRGVMLGGVSGGPLILAAAGLMEGRRMTVHWEHMAKLEEIMPDAMIERTLYVIDRDRVTCAGGIAPLDMAHSLIAKRHGAEFARRVSDWFLHTDVRPSEGAQRSGLMERYGTRNRTVIDAIRLMHDHLAAPLPLPKLAALCGVSSRHLNRLFREHVGEPAMRFYMVLRLERAGQLLRTSSMSVTEIALAVGFSSTGHFSTAFSRHNGMSPSEFSIRSAGS